MSPSHLADFALLPTPNSQVVGRREIEAAEVQGRRGGVEFTGHGPTRDTHSIETCSQNSFHR